MGELAVAICTRPMGLLREPLILSLSSATRSFSITASECAARDHAFTAGRRATGIEVAIDPKQTHVTISGIDRQKVGQVAADMRSLRKPDPYKNKGVRYTGEKLKKKVGKTGAK